MGKELGRNRLIANKLRKYEYAQRAADAEIELFFYPDTYTPPSLTDDGERTITIFDTKKKRAFKPPTPDDSHLFPKPREITAAEQAEIILLDATMNFPRTEYTDEVLDSIIHSAVTLKR